MARPRLTYPTDVTAEEWQILKPLLPPEQAGSRPRKYPMREVRKGLPSVRRAGCAGRRVPHDRPPWQPAYQTWRAGRRDGTWLRSHDHLRDAVRTRLGRHPQPSAAIIEAQTVKTTELAIVERPRRWGWYPIDVEPPPVPAFTVLPRRWVVERTIAWGGRSRRLSKAYEYLPERREAMIDLARRRRMRHRRVRQAPYGVPSPQRQGLRGLARPF